MTDQMMDARAAFEAYISKDFGDLGTFGQGRHVHYRNSGVNNAWDGWRACMRWLAAPAPESQSAFALRALVAAGHVEQHQVDGALSLARGAAPVPDVPEATEPTPEMLARFVSEYNSTAPVNLTKRQLSRARRAYAAMLAAVRPEVEHV